MSLVRTEDCLKVDVDHVHFSFESQHDGFKLEQVQFWIGSVNHPWVWLFVKLFLYQFSLSHYCECSLGYFLLRTHKSSAICGLGVWYSWHCFESFSKHATGLNLADFLIFHQVKGSLFVCQDSMPQRLATTNLLHSWVNCTDGDEAIKIHQLFHVIHEEELCVVVVQVKNECLVNYYNLEEILVVDSGMLCSSWLDSQECCLWYFEEVDVFLVFILIEHFLERYGLFYLFFLDVDETNLVIKFTFVSKIRT